MKKNMMGLLLGVFIGALCQVLRLPLPAPPVFTGAFLVVAMTLGYRATDRWMGARQRERVGRESLSGGPVEG